MTYAATVQLADGRLVAGDSEEWRAECECRHLLRMPVDARRERLEVVLKRRGQAEVDRIVGAMKALRARGAA